MKIVSLSIMAMFYMAAGINHFWHPAPYEKIMPPYIPLPLTMVYLSGICEIIFGALLFPPSTRRPAAWLIIALLIAIFPANIQMALDNAHHHDPETWLTILRLPIQLLLIAWAWSFTGSANIQKAAR